MVDNVVDVQLVQQRITVLRSVSIWSDRGKKKQKKELPKEIQFTYLGNRRSEDNNFIELAHSLHELIYTWPLDDIHIMVVSFDFNGYCEVGLVEDL